MSGEIPQLPCDLWGGSLRLGSDFCGIIPIPLDYDGQIEIRLQQDGELRMTGTHVQLQLVGEAAYIDKLPGSR